MQTYKETHFLFSAMCLDARSKEGMERKELVLHSKTRIRGLQDENDDDDETRRRRTRALECKEKLDPTDPRPQARTELKEGTEE